MSTRDLTASSSIARPHGSPGAKLLYLALCYLTAENNEKTCCATLSELSATTDQSVRSLKKNLKLLKQGGYIRIMPGFFGVKFYEILNRSSSSRRKAKDAPSPAVNAEMQRTAKCA